MTANRKHLFRTIVLAFAMTIVFVGVTPVHAQEYKEIFNAGLQAAKANDLTGALDQFTKAADAAKAEGDAEVERRSHELIAKIEYSVGRSFMKTERFDEALAHFANGIAHYPTYSKNYLARASTLKTMGEVDAAIEGYVETIAHAQAESDTKTARTAEEAIRQHFVYLASSALSRNGSRVSRNDADEALQSLVTLQEYVDADSDVFFYLATVHKVKGEFQDAVSLADQALAVHRGSRTDKAKIYYVKAEALMSIGDNSGAKSAFQNAAYGPYKTSAEHFLETLGTD